MILFPLIESFAPLFPPSRVRVILLPAVASAAEIVAGETVTIPVALDVTFTLVAKLEMCTEVFFVVYSFW